MDSGQASVSKHSLKVCVKFIFQIGMSVPRGKGGCPAWPPFLPSSLLSLSDSGLEGTVPAREPKALGCTAQLSPSPS